MRRRFLVATVLLDLASLALATIPASIFVFDRVLPWKGAPRIWPLLSILAGGSLIGSYLTHRSTRSGVPRPSYGRAVSIAVLTLAVTAVAALAWRDQFYFSRRFIGFTMAGQLLAMLAHRVVARSRPWSEDLLVVSSAKELIDHLRMAPHARLLDVMDPRSEYAPAPPPPDATLAVDLSEPLSEAMARYVTSSSAAGYPIIPLGVVYEDHTGRMPIVHLADGWELESPFQDGGLYAPFKRLFDIVLTLLVAPLVLVMAALTWLVIRLDSKGPAIFKQPRVGLRGRTFMIYKFRTMKNGASVGEPSFASPDDPRLTRVGRWLRKTRLDELPQLWNVLKGDLSLVGPRPEQVEFVRQFSERIPFYAQRHQVRPGVTGWAQVNYGYADDEADTVDKLTFDLYYVKNMSLWLDLHVLGKSFWTVLSGFGAQ